MMNKQEVIEKIEKEKSNLNAWEDLTRNRALDDALAIVRKLDEPEKPVVPKCVADWLEVCKDNLALSLANSMNNIVMRTNNQPDKTIHWLAKNSETFAKSWIYGYEVEKEKLYEVKFSNEDFGKLYIGIRRKTNTLGFGVLPLNNDEVKSWFTEDELKKLKFWKNPAFETNEVK